MGGIGNDERTNAQVCMVIRDSSYLDRAYWSRRELFEIGRIWCTSSARSLRRGNYLSRRYSLGLALGLYGGSRVDERLLLFFVVPGVLATDQPYSRTQPSDEADTMKTRLFEVVAVLFIVSVTSTAAQLADSNEKLTEKARQEYAAGKFADAERDFRELTKRDPSNVEGQIYLGQTLFRQEKYADSVTPYEKARELEKTGTRLSSDQHRILVDQLAMAYGISGDLKKSRALLETAIRDDPEYPLNYYNLACVYAEDGDKGEVLANLSLAFDRKEHVLRGEQMPNPRTDSSFQKYLRDEEFIKLLAKLGY
jgi:tetratricopeptide (TPR) repeat protein